MQRSSKTCRRLQSPHIGINQMLTENQITKVPTTGTISSNRRTHSRGMQAYKRKKCLQAAPARDSWDFTLINSKGKAS
jgi:hypothetical protein